MPRYREIETVPVDPFRDRFLELNRQGVSASEICRRLDWVETKQVAEVNRLKRSIGLSRDSRGDMRQRVTFDMAERLCEALDMDLREGGL